MHWTHDSSFLVAESYVNPDESITPHESIAWVERVELPHVLDSDYPGDFPKLLTELMHAVLRLATRVKTEPVLTEEG